MTKISNILWGNDFIVFQFDVSLIGQPGDFLGFYMNSYGVVSYDELSTATENYCGENKKPVITEDVNLSYSAVGDRDYAIKFTLCQFSKFLYFCITA